MLIPSDFLPIVHDNDCTEINPADVKLPAEESIVRLYSAPLPKILGRLRFIAGSGCGQRGESEWQRWEVWQAKNAGGVSWGYIHKNLKAIDRGVGGGKANLLFEWRGETAERIIAIVRQPESYPFLNRYLAFPGPNSNTYVAWVLRRAEVAHRLSRFALGRGFPVGGSVAGTETVG